MNYRRNEIYVSNECRFYLSLKAKQTVAGTEAKRTEDETADCDLINLYTKEHPEWLIAWDKREKARQAHRKDLEQIEAEALNFKSPTI